MTETAKITLKSPIALPAPVRRSSGVALGNRVDFIRTAAGSFDLRRRTGTSADLRGIVKPAEPVTGEYIDRWISEARSSGYGAEEE